MKKSIFWMAIPVTLLTLLFVTTTSAEKMAVGSCANSFANYTMTPDTLRKDPICGMMADDTKKDTVHYKSKVYAFCSKHCKTEFVKDPEAHIAKKKN